MQENQLFKLLKLRAIQIPNRVWVSPMCQYSSRDGHPTDWHLVHLGSRAVGGAGLVMVEATAVSPEGRISPDDSGMWSDEHIPSFKRVTEFLKEHGSVAAIQLAHAGRKASTFAPWAGSGMVPKEKGGWQPVAPSAIAFHEKDLAPREMSLNDMAKVISDFQNAARRSLKAGFQVIELHMAHGYLMHEFLSPLSNNRTDQYGGSLENRMRFPLEVATAVRSTWPADLPIFARISATDWADGADELLHPTKERTQSWDLNQSLVLVQKLKEIGIDLIDCSTGGTLAKAEIPVGPGYQVSFSEAIRKQTGILTAAVGMITEAAQAEAILVEQKADAIFIGREFLRNPYWPQQAAKSLGAKLLKPKQYGRS